MLLKWGIVSAGKISNDFAEALKTLPHDQCQVVAVAARDKSRADEFAKKHNIPDVYTSYEKLASNEDIDIMYVGSLNTQHFEISKLMLEHGKHVLCEKPLCMNANEVEELIKLAKERSLFLMEGMWSRFFPVYKEVIKVLDTAQIGEPIQLVANFGVHMTSDRISKRNLGGSIILDLGPYTTQLALLVFGRHTPYKLTAAGHLNEDEIDESYTCLLKYPNGKMATLIHHGRVNFDNDAYIYGTKGYIKIHQPLWCPTEVTINGKTTEFPLPEHDKSSFNYINSAGLRYEAIEVRRCIEQGLLESPFMTLDDSLNIAKIEDAIRAQLGVKFDCDNK